MEALPSSYPIPMLSRGLRPGRAALGLALLGATLGSALDGIHTHTATTFYPHPVWWKMAWWTPPLFAAAAVSIGLSRPLFDLFLYGRIHERARPRDAALSGMALFILAYALSGLLPLPSSAVAAVLAVVFACSWLLCDRTLVGLLHALGTAAGGVLVEALLIRGGYFFYTQGGDVAGVPVWLPWLYASASVGVGALGHRLIHR